MKAPWLAFIALLWVLTASVRAQSPAPPNAPPQEGGDAPPQEGGDDPGVAPPAKPAPAPASKTPAKPKAARPKVPARAPAPVSLPTEAPDQETGDLGPLPPATLPSTAEIKAGPPTPSRSPSPRPPTAEIKAGPPLPPRKIPAKELKPKNPVAATPTPAEGQAPRPAPNASPSSPTTGAPTTGVPTTGVPTTDTPATKNEGENPPEHEAGDIAPPASSAPPAPSGPAVDVLPEHEQGELQAPVPAPPTPAESDKPPTAAPSPPEHEQGEFQAPVPPASPPPASPPPASPQSPPLASPQSPPASPQPPPPASPQSPPASSLTPVEGAESAIDVPTPSPPDQEQGALPPEAPDQEQGEGSLAPADTNTDAKAPSAQGDSSIPDQETGETAIAPASHNTQTLPINDPNAPPAQTITPPIQPLPTPSPPSAPKVTAEILEPELPSAMQAPFDLFVNEVPKGQIIVALVEDDVYVRPQDLREAGIAPLPGREQVMFEEKYLSLKSLTPPLSYVLDDRAIALRITAPVDLLPYTSLDLGTTPTGVIYQQDTSGFFNYSARLTDFGQLDVYQEVGASHDGNLAFSSMYMSTVNGPTRGLTYYTVNDRETLRRLTFGDSLAQTGPLGSSGFVGGVSLARTFDLDPYLVTSPRIGFSGSTLTPSTVDVYINGALVRSEQIAPGAFQLNNLRVTGGRGQATYVIRDVFGREQRVDIPFYMSGSVLAKNLEEYEYTIGATRENIGTESFGYQRIAFLGRHRIGLTNDLTLSGRVEATDHVASAGPSLTALTPIGQVELDVGTSYERDRGAGAAGFVSYSFLSRYFSAGLYGRMLSDHYATANVSSTADHVVRELGLFQSTPVLDRLTLSSQAQLIQYRGERQTWRLSASTGTRLISHLMLLTYGSVSALDTGDRSWELFSSLSYVFGQRHSTSLQTRLRDRDGSLTFDANKSLPVGVGYGYRASLTLDEANNAGAMAQYQTSFGRYGANYTMFDNEEHHVGLEAAGAIAIVPGIGVFPTLPVQDAFGVIRVRGVKNVRGYINNQEIGKTDRNGNLVVPNLLSYYGNRLSISSEDVPIRYTLELTERTIAPPQRGVAVADFPVSTPHFYRGTMRVQIQGNVVVPKHGQVRVNVQGNELVSPLGDLAEFELSEVPSGAQTVWVDFLGGTCEMELDFPDSTDIVIELGEVRCEMP